jgi:hypothetical protein
MAVIYLRSSDGSDASDGLTWANAKATLAAALTAAGAGGTVYVSDNHAESQVTSLTLTSPGTVDSPTRVICVDDTGDPEPPTAVATGASVTDSAGGTFTLAGVAYSYGVDYHENDTSSNRGFTLASGAYWRIEAGLISVANSTSGGITAGTTTSGYVASRLELINTDITFSSDHRINPSKCEFVWEGGTLTHAGTVLFDDQGVQGLVVVRGVDLSGLASGDSLVDVTQAVPSTYLFENCKLGSSVSLTTGTHPGQFGPKVLLVNCDSDDTNYRYCKKTYQGEITFTGDLIVRTGGASDGTRAISRKMVSSANAKFYSPLVSDPIAVWLETLGSTTVTVEVVTDNVTLTDAEAWIEVEYLGTSGFPISSIGSDRASNILSTPANQTSSSETWTTTGLGTPIKQKLAVTFTPAEKGPALIRVHLAKASTTMYFCPKADVT